MRKVFLALLLVVPFASEVALAQSNAIDIICADCRDPLKYPDDYANFAFNQIYGDHAWLTPAQADDFFIHNLKGDRVYVDVDFIMSGVKILGNTLPLWPTHTLKITLALPNGHIHTAIRSIFQTSLPVPSPDCRDH